MKTSTRRPCGRPVSAHRALAAASPSVPTFICLAEPYNGPRGGEKGARALRLGGIRGRRQVRDRGRGALKALSARSSSSVSAGVDVPPQLVQPAALEGDR